MEIFLFLQGFLDCLVDHETDGIDGDGSDEDYGEASVEVEDAESGRVEYLGVGLAALDFGFDGVKGVGISPEAETGY